MTDIKLAIRNRTSTAGRSAADGGAVQEIVMVQKKVAFWKNATFFCNNE